MSNTQLKRPGQSVTSMHMMITSIIGVVVTALCCYTFYVFRTGATKEQNITNAMKAIQAATEIVSSMAERGLPAIRTRLEDLDSKNRVLEQGQRKISSVVDRLSTSGTAAPPPPSDPIASEAAILEARRAARASKA